MKLATDPGAKTPFILEEMNLEELKLFFENEIRTPGLLIEKHFVDDKLCLVVRWENEKGQYPFYHGTEEEALRKIIRRFSIPQTIDDSYIKTKLDIQFFFAI